MDKITERKTACIAILGQAIKMDNFIFSLNAWYDVDKTPQLSYHLCK